MPVARGDRLARRSPALKLRRLVRCYLIGIEIEVELVFGLAPKSTKCNLSLRNRRPRRLCALPVPTSPAGSGPGFQSPSRHNLARGILHII